MDNLILSRLAEKPDHLALPGFLHGSHGADDTIQAPSASCLWRSRRTFRLHFLRQIRRTCKSLESWLGAFFTARWFPWRKHLTAKSLTPARAQRPLTEYDKFMLDIKGQCVCVCYSDDIYIYVICEYNRVYIYTTHNRQYVYTIINIWCVSQSLRYMI